MNWYLYTDEDGVRHAYAGPTLKHYTHQRIPCAEAIHWTWSSGEYCFN